MVPPKSARSKNCTRFASKFHGTPPGQSTQQIWPALWGVLKPSQHIHIPGLSQAARVDCHIYIYIFCTLSGNSAVSGNLMTFTLLVNHHRPWKSQNFLVVSLIFQPRWLPGSMLIYMTFMSIFYRWWTPWTLGTWRVTGKRGPRRRWWISCMPNRRPVPIRWPWDQWG